MLYKMDNTMFGGNTPPLPQWTGAPYGIIQVQAILYASLAASLFSAFFAMLGKQWLNRYASTGMRGTSIERSQDRQRKLDGTATWCFDYVMESLPLMLQFALLLLGCALSRYLWDINATIARVVVGVTGFGVAFYIFVIVAGTAFASCPYQTPLARILCHTPYILHYIRHILRHTFHHILALWNFPARYFEMMLSRVHSACPIEAHRLNRRTAVLDSQCISWILQMSLERSIRLSTLKFLATTPTLVEFNPALVSDCFNILLDCIKVNEDKPVIVQGMEQLAEASSMCFLLTYSHLLFVDFTSSAVSDIERRYERIFPCSLGVTNLPLPHILGTIHKAFNWGVNPAIKWQDYKPTNHEHVVVACAIYELAWSERRLRTEISPLYVSFASHYISQDPLPPPSVIAYCLLIIAIDLGCNVPKTMVLAERCVHVRRISTTLLTEIQCTARGDF